MKAMHKDLDAKMFVTKLFIIEGLEVNSKHNCQIVKNQFSKMLLKHNNVKILHNGYLTTCKMHLVRKTLTRLCGYCDFTWELYFNSKDKTNTIEGQTQNQCFMDISLG